MIWWWVDSFMIWLIMIENPTRFSLTTKWTCIPWDLVKYIISKYSITTAQLLDIWWIPTWDSSQTPLTYAASVEYKRQKAWNKHSIIDFRVPSKELQLTLNQTDISFFHWSLIDPKFIDSTMSKIQPAVITASQVLVNDLHTSNQRHNKNRRTYLPDQYWVDEDIAKIIRNSISKWTILLVASNWQWYEQLPNFLKTRKNNLVEYYSDVNAWLTNAYTYLFRK